MAGSYGHVRPVHRDADHDQGGWSLVENMGDAYETVEQLLWLVLFFAREFGAEPLVEIDERIEHALDTIYYPMVRGEQPKDAAYLAVEEVMGK